MGTKKKKHKQKHKQKHQQKHQQSTGNYIKENKAENIIESKIDNKEEKKIDNKINKGNVALWIFYIVVCSALIIYTGIGLCSKVAGKHIEKVTVEDKQVIYEGKTAQTYKNPSVSYKGIKYQLSDEKGNIYELKMEHYMGSRLVVGKKVHAFVSNNPEKKRAGATLSRVIANLAGFCLSLFGLRWSVYLLLNEFGREIKKNKLTRLLFDSELFFAIEFLGFLFILVIFGIFMDLLDMYICSINL